MLEFKDIKVRLGKAVILNGACLSVKEGSVCVLLGRNGSGKSTLLDTVAGLIPYSGSIILDGQPLSSLSTGERAKKIVYLPQKLSDSSLKVTDLVKLGRFAEKGLLSSMSENDIEAVESAIRTMELTSKAHLPVSSLSGGERQRVYIAMVLASGAPYLLLDEPTTYLDIDAARSICSTIGTLSKELGKTVLTVFHDLSSAMSVADKICVLDSGIIVFEGTPDEFADSDVPQKVFGAVCTKYGGRYYFS